MLTQATHDALRSLQAVFSLLPVMRLMNRIDSTLLRLKRCHILQKNPLFERGFKGATMIKKTGSGITTNTLASWRKRCASVSSI